MTYDIVGVASVCVVAAEGQVAKCGYAILCEVAHDVRRGHVKLEHTVGDHPSEVLLPKVVVRQDRFIRRTRTLPQSP